MKRFFLVAISFLLLNNTSAFAGEETQPDSLPTHSQVETGLLEIGTSTAQPVFAYVPEHYKDTRSYPLIISFPGNAQPAEEHIHEWSAFAEKSSFIIVAPPLNLREGDSPYDHDRWVVGLVKEMMIRYRISKNRIFLFGKDRAAQYAAYLGTNYADQFSGAALLNGAWEGPWARLIKSHKHMEEQIPFFVGVTQKELAPPIERKAVELQEKGYFVQIETFEDGNLFREKAFEWLDRKSEAWADQVKGSQESLGHKVWRNIVGNVKIE